MISFIFSNTHIFCAQWTRVKQAPFVTDFYYRPLLHPLKDIINQEPELNAVLGTAIRQVVDTFAIDGNDATIILEDDLVYHDSMKFEPGISNTKAWDYITWRVRQQWGSRAADLVTFAQIQLPVENQYHIVSCRSDFIRILKLSIAELGANPVWMGTVTNTLLDSEAGNISAYVFHQGAYYRLVSRSAEGLGIGNVKFISGKVKTSAVIGEPEAIMALLSPPAEDSSATPVRLVDKLSSTKRAQWQSYDCREMVPLQGINTEGVNIPDNIPERYLNVLTSLINGQAAGISMNLFGAEGIQEIGSHPDEGDEKTPAPEDKPIIPAVEKPKRSSPNYYFIFILIGILAGVLYLWLKKTPDSRDLSVPEATEESRKQSTETGEAGAYSDALIRALNSSYTQVITLTNILSTIDLNNIFYLSLTNSQLKLEMATSDTIHLTSIIGGLPRKYTVEKIECCGGSKHGLEYSVASLEAPIRNVWHKYTTIKKILSDSTATAKLRELNTVTSGYGRYVPLILKVKSSADIFKIVELLPLMRDNVLLKKVVITNNPALPAPEAVFYLAVLLPHNNI